MTRIVYRFLGLLWCAFLFQACQPSAPSLPTGMWRGELFLGEEKGSLPFNFELKNTETGYQALLYNADEVLEMESVRVNGDSVFIRMAIFDTEIKAKLSADARLEGAFYNYSRGNNYQLPFSAKHGVETRFMTQASANKSFDGRWKTTFSPDTDEPEDAVAIFTQTGDNVTGTFLTETGDYRFLQGRVVGDSLKLSTFDGDHAFLFLAKQNEVGELSGVFYSGNHWQTSWVATRDEDFELRDPESLTYLKEGYDKMEFSFPDTDSALVSLDDERFKDKVVILQIMGSWCPNCMDESKYFASIYPRYKERGLEIIGLAYEREKNFQRAASNIRRLQKHFSIDYEILLAGSSDKTEAAETLPMLNHIMAFPTAIFIDREGKVQKIHTGFYGPGTGKYYDQYVEKTERLIESML